MRVERHLTGAGPPASSSSAATPALSRSSFGSWSSCPPRMWPRRNVAISEAMMLPPDTNAAALMRDDTTVVCPREGGGAPPAPDR